MKRKIKNWLICMLFLMGILITEINVIPMQNVFAKDNKQDIEYGIETSGNLSVFNSEQTVYAADTSTAYTTGSSETGTWIHESNGKWWYRHADGSYTKNAWEYINGKWYHFDKYGWMQTGWLSLNGKWYYLTADGDMVTGWQKINGKWYYFKNDGSMQTGWIRLDGKWYYLNDDGSMQIGWKKINESWYYFLSNGSMNTKALTLGSRKYTFYSSGKLLSTEILITRQKQEKSNWCWAASSVMVGTYNTNSTRTQSDTVKYVKGSLINQGGTDSEAVKALNYSSNFTKTGEIVRPLSFKNAVSSIDNNHPFEMHISWNGGGGHMIVGAGYDLEARSVRAIDPWSDTKTTYYDYSSLINGANLLTGTGKCTSMIIY
ncbi:MAG: C39 family peptidase [Clostridiales bacterium]|nr:C39 family peptidase [Clostridiales bacterium]